VLLFNIHHDEVFDARFDNLEVGVLNSLDLFLHVCG